MTLKDLRFDLLPRQEKSIIALFALLAAPPLYYLYRFRSSIKARVKEIEKSVSLVKVVRNKNLSVGKKNRVICMELDPTFVKENAEWNMMSFGEYLSQLEPAEKSGFNHLFLQKELEITIGNTLLKTLGRTYGAALLPLLGASSVAGSIAGISNKISNFLARSILSDDKEADAAFDPMAFDLSLMEIISF
eukprot:CAMPEP_0198291676 /NCGR_PEP_ID=MMETSP1449-20131203/9130_1 /TAXON_ID=420275 /ORGANISM="Attheya septentrionalis, Strain CCMP2084" /LENGTH=189 /DNA_ID=CAMNT_0043990347 /DNA_START=70 /DNA_END=636 /DNA_ORIENTATION=+